MKKLLSIAILFVMVAMVATSVCAMSSSELAEKLYAIGAKYGATSADKLRVEKYFEQYPATDAQAEQLIAKANEAAAAMEAQGVTDIKDLTTEGKDKLRTIATEAGSIVGATVKFGTKTIEIYKEGKLVETVSYNNGKLAYTGNTVNTVVIISLVAIIALATVVAIRKKKANA